ncbi:MAG TPA: thiamine phosphate synthase [Thiomicrospira sp.]|jgi:thiamine-phosphate pyrophosphorylase|nr:thiamine phosphate synthase [Thiomicrospira sp.]
MSSIITPSHHSARISGLYAITDSNLLTPENTLDKVRLALQGGARVVQFRDKVSPQNIKLEIAQELQQLCQTYQACFIVNDDIQLAQQVNADGVHIGKDDDDIHKARQRLGSNKIIGVSCYNDLQRAKQMQQLGADYVAFGRFFPSKTKPNAHQADIDTLLKAKLELTIPIVAIGGITQENAQFLINAGADSIAVIHGVFANSDVKSASQQLSQLF